MRKRVRIRVNGLGRAIRRRRRWELTEETKTRHQKMSERIRKRMRKVEKTDRIKKRKKQRRKKAKGIGMGPLFNLYQRKLGGCEARKGPGRGGVRPPWGRPGGIRNSSLFSAPVSVVSLAALVIIMMILIKSPKRWCGFCPKLGFHYFLNYFTSFCFSNPIFFKQQPRVKEVGGIIQCLYKYQIQFHVCSGLRPDCIT